MASGGPSSSQYSSGLGMKWQNYNDLPEHVRSTCGNIFEKVGKANETKEGPSDSSRKGFWNLGLSFTACDARGSIANAKYIQLNPGWSLEQARAETIIHWDMAEGERITIYNINLAVCWARSRLLRELRRQPDAAPTSITSRLQLSENEVPVKFDELVKLITCRERLKEMAVFGAEYERVLAARPHSGQKPIG